MGKAAALARAGDRIIGFFAMILILFLLAFGGYSLWDTWRLYRQAYGSEYLEYKPAGETDENPTLEELIKINPDVCGWLTIDGTHIDYPVVQGEDNMQYVNQDVFGEFSFSGAIFLDSGNTRDFSDSYQLLYGHHMENGAMFGDVAEFENKEFFQEHQTGTLYLPEATYHIEIFACVQTDAYDAVIYNVSESMDMEKLLRRVKETALQSREIGVTVSDQIIACSTCRDAQTNGRTVLLGRLEKR